MKILIIRFSSIGDIVLTTPVIRVLKTKLGGVEIHFATKRQYEDVLKCNPYIDKLHFLDLSISVLIKELKAEKFDCIVDLHNNLRTKLIKFSLGVKSYSYNKINIEKLLMVKFKINKLPPLHIVDRYLATVAPLGVTADDKGLDYYISENEEFPLEWLPEKFRTDYVAFAIGGQHSTKQLPVKRIIELCDKINRPIVLLGGKEDAWNGELVEQFFENNTTDELSSDLKILNKKTIVFNACGKLKLNQSASLVRQAQYVFTHDTGLMHIAAAYKKEIFSIWGNTIPSFGMYPYRTKFTLLENKSLRCRPCSKIGFSKCPKGHFKCMNDIDFDFNLPA